MEEVLEQRSTSAAGYVTGNWLEARTLHDVHVTTLNAS